MKKGKKKEGLKITRRQFLKGAAATGIGLALPLKFGVGTAHAFANSDPLTKWAQAIRGLKFYPGFPLGTGDPNGIPVLQPQVDPVFTNTDYYQITAGQFTDYLHSQFTSGTALWGYWDTNNPVKRHLAGIIIADRGTPVRIRFTNTLPGQHILPLDTTVTGANAAHNRIAVHQHGGLVPWTSDGGPFDWWTPPGLNYATGLSFPNGPGGFLDQLYPAGQKMVNGQADYYYPNDASTRLVWYHDHAHGITRLNAYAGLASGYLILDAAQTTLTTPVTNFPKGKIPELGSTIPLIFQDKIFVSSTTQVTDPTWPTVSPQISVGSLWYAHIYDPKLYRWFQGKKTITPPNPSCVPEFFGDTMLCNGTVYPKLTVEPKRYRFIILNACNARFLNINLLDATNTGGYVATNPKTLFANTAPTVNPPGPKIIQIGAEGGFLGQEVTYNNNVPANPATFTGNLLMAPAERADVIIDFSGQQGNTFIMYNDAPGPYPVGAPMNDYFLGNPGNAIQPPNANSGPDTRNILQIVVNTPTPLPNDPQPKDQAGAYLPIFTNQSFIDPAPIVPYPATIPAVGPLPALTPPAPGVIPAGQPYAGTTVAPYRKLTLNEDFDPWGRLRQLLGLTTINPATGNYGIEYTTLPATETPTAGQIEVWQIFNTTADTHPMHFHLVNVQVLQRQPFRLNNGRFNLSGVARGPELNEVGWKETVRMNPGEVTTIVMKFDLPPVPFIVPTSTRTGNNEFVWHCHILEHEEHDMMRPLVVSGANPVAAFAIKPNAVTVSKSSVTLPLTLKFDAFFGYQPTTVLSSDAANYPPVKPVPPLPDDGGFTVSITLASPITPVGTPVTFTVTDGKGSVATATLTVTA